MTQEALKLALEALELNNVKWKALADSGDSGHWKAEDQSYYKQTEQAITVIKEALAQPEQEPVAWMQSDEAHISLWKDNYHTIPLFTHPPQRTWVGLTRMELIKCGVFPWGMSYQLCQAIEAKLKEKNT